jgi:hypothetical protein
MTAPTMKEGLILLSAGLENHAAANSVRSGAGDTLVLESLFCHTQSYARLEQVHGMPGRIP